MEGCPHPPAPPPFRERGSLAKRNPLLEEKRGAEFQIPPLPERGRGAASRSTKAIHLCTSVCTSVLYQHYKPSPARALAAASLLPTKWAVTMTINSVSVAFFVVGSVSGRSSR